MGNCKICGKPKSKFHMGSKLVCMKCDELLFDLEIECDEEAPVEKKTAQITPKPTQIKKPQVATKK